MRSDTQPPSTEPLESQFHTLPVVKSWSYIKIEGGCTIWTETLSCVEIDNVADAVAAPVDYPVMSIKWRRISADLSKVLHEVMGMKERRLTLTTT